MWKHENVKTVIDILIDILIDIDIAVIDILKVCNFSTFLWFLFFPQI